MNGTTQIASAKILENMMDQDKQIFCLVQIEQKHIEELAADAGVTLNQNQLNKLATQVHDEMNYHAMQFIEKKLACKIRS